MCPLNKKRSLETFIGEKDQEIGVMITIMIGYVMRHKYTKYNYFIYYCRLFVFVIQQNLYNTWKMEQKELDECFMGDMRL